MTVVLISLEYARLMLSQIPLLYRPRNLQFSVIAVLFLCNIFSLLSCTVDTQPLPDDGNYRDVERAIGRDTLLEGKPRPCAAHRRAKDRYGRSLAYVFFRRRHVAEH